MLKKILFLPLKCSLCPKFISQKRNTKKILMGQFIERGIEEARETGDFVILVYNNKISAVAQIDGDLVKAKKVLG